MPRSTGPPRPRPKPAPRPRKLTPGRAQLEAEIERLRTLCASYGVHADSERERADRLEGSREHHILVSESRLKRAEKAEVEIARLKQEVNEKDERIYDEFGCGEPYTSPYPEASTK